jgi:hypothetical protein
VSVRGWDDGVTVCKDAVVRMSTYGTDCRAYLVHLLSVFGDFLPLVRGPRTFQL